MSRGQGGGAWAWHAAGLNSRLQRRPFAAQGTGVHLVSPTAKPISSLTSLSPPLTRRVDHAVRPRLVSQLDKLLGAVLQRGKAEGAQ